jgi:hypothetical protein
LASCRCNSKPVLARNTLFLSDSNAWKIIARRLYSPWSIPSGSVCTLCSTQPSWKKIAASPFTSVAISSIGIISLKIPFASFVPYFSFFASLQFLIHLVHRRNRIQRHRIILEHCRLLSDVNFFGLWKLPPLISK